MKKGKKILKLYMLISVLVSVMILFTLTLTTTHATEPAQTVTITLDENGLPTASGTGWTYDNSTKILTLNSGYEFTIKEDTTALKPCACATVNNGTIADGYFDGDVTNYGVIKKGTFKVIINCLGGIIQTTTNTPNIFVLDGTTDVLLYMNYEGATPLSYTENVSFGSLPKEPVGTGYQFAGWYDNDEYTGEKVTEVNNNTSELFAKWYRTYTITYDLDGGVNGNNPAQYTAESDVITLLDASKSGYTFIGWTGNGITNPTSGIKIVQGTSGNLTFTAHFLTNATPTPAASAGAHVVTCEEAGFGTGSYWNESTKSCVTPVRTPEPTENVFLRATPIPLPKTTPSAEQTPGATPTPTLTPTPTPTPTPMLTPSGTAQAGKGKDLAVANVALGAIAIAAGVYAATASGTAETTMAAKVIGVAGIGVAVGAFLLTQEFGGNFTMVDNSTIWFAGAAAGSTTAAVMKAIAAKDTITK